MDFSYHKIQNIQKKYVSDRVVQFFDLKSFRWPGGAEA